MNEIIEKSKMSRRRFLKHSSKKLLFSDWLTQIIAFVIVGVVFYGISQFGTALALSVNEIFSNLKLTNTILSVFTVFATAMLVPTVYGLVVFEIKAVSGEKYGFSDIFSAFSTAEVLFKSYDLFFGLVFRYAVFFLPAFALYVFNTYFYTDDIFSKPVYFEGIDVIMFSLRTLFVVLLYAGIVLSCKSFVAVYVSVKTDKNVRECFMIAKKCLRGNITEVLKFAISFFPLFVVSMFTVGFLYILYTIPYMFISFTTLAKYLYDKRLYFINNPDYVQNILINEIGE